MILAPLLTHAATAAVVAANFNDLSAGNIQTQGGGSGMSGSWGDTGTISVVTGDLTAPSSTNYAITQTGTAQSVQGGHTEYRQSSRPLAAAMTGTVWFSFLANNAASTSVSGITFNVSGFTSGTPRIGLTGDTFYAGLNTYTASSATVTLGQTALILGRLGINSAGNETLEVWLNPDVANGIAGLGAATASFNEEAASINGGVSRIAIAAYRNATGSGGQMDSILLSNAADQNLAFADVTGVLVPESSSLVLTIAGAGILFRRRR